MKTIYRNILSIFGLAAILVVITNILAGCGAQKPPNIVLIVVDTLRADHLSCYGYAVDTSPFISKLASQGVLFERAYSASSWTSPGTASIHTSLYPFQHGVTSGFLATKRGRATDPKIKLNRIPDDAVTIAEVMKNAGYRTFAVTDNLNITEEQGFSQGFDYFQNYNYETADTVNRRLNEWRDEIENAQPYFLYIHYNDPHQPYNRRKPWFTVEGSKPVTRVTAYDSEIGYVDSKIEEAFELFGWDSGAFLMITSDHGEEFYEHGELGHGHNLYAETIHVPLVMFPALQDEPGARISSPVSTIDVLPTLRAAAGLPASPADEGVSLIDAAGAAKEHRGDNRFLISHLERKWGESRTGMTEYVLRSVISGDWKYIVTIPDLEELYNLRQDPGETNNVLEENVATATAFKQHLFSFESDCARLEQIDFDVPVDDKLLKKLESLGYVR